MSIQQEINDLTGSKILSYNPLLSKMLKDVISSLLLQQLLYWRDRSNNDEFYKTNQELCNELGISITQLKRAKSNLIKLNFIICKNKSMPARTFYYINTEVIKNFIFSWQETYQQETNKKTHKTKQQVGIKPTNKLVENTPTSWYKTYQQVGIKPTNKLVENLPTGHETNKEKSISEDVSKNIEYNIDYNIDYNNITSKDVSLLDTKKDIKDIDTNTSLVSNEVILNNKQIKKDKGGGGVVDDCRKIKRSDFMKIASVSNKQVASVVLKWAKENIKDFENNFDIDILKKVVKELFDTNNNIGYILKALKNGAYWKIFWDSVDNNCKQQEVKKDEEIEKWIDEMAMYLAKTKGQSVEKFLEEARKNPENAEYFKYN